MAEKEIKIKVTTEADVKDVDDLEEALQRLQDSKVTVSVDAESTELEDIESRIEELEQKRADIYMGVDDSDLEEVEAELEELESRQIELTGTVEISGTEEAAQGLDSVEQSSDNASSALESMALLDIAGTLSQWGSAAENFAQDLNNMAISTEQLAIQTGMTDAEMTGMINNITNATFPREEALMYVKSLDQIGVSAQNLGASATGLDRINDAFHLGAEKTNRLGQELSVLGVDMNNVSSSFNALAYANANTVGGMDNYFTFLQRYDAQFKELGMNVDQASVAIVAATQKFGGGRAALSGMNQALKNCNGDMAALERELGLTAGSLTNASQLTGQYAGQLDAMADKEAEHKTPTQQLAAALDDVTASLDGVISPFSGFLGMIGNAGSFAVGINGIIQLTQTIREAEAAQAALNLVMGMNPILLIVMAVIALIAILWYLYNTCEPVRNAIDGIWAGVTGAIQPIIDSVQWLIDKLTDLANGDWTVTIEIIKAGVSSGVDTVTDIADNDLSCGIVGAIAGPEALAQVDEAMPEFKEKLSTSINDMLQSIWDDGTQGFLGWLGEISGIDTASYLQGMQTAFMGIPDYVNQAGIGVLQGFQNMLTGVSTSLNNIITVIINFGGRLVSSITTAAHNAWTSFVNNIKGMWKHMQEEVDAILGEAERLLRELPGKLWNAAVRMVQGWLTGSGEGSPGFMFYAFDEDLGAMEDRARNNRVPDLIGGTARDMVSSWGNPELSYDVTGGGSDDSTVVNLLRELVELLKTRRGGDLVFNHYGDVDTEERLQRILDFIVRATDWDNDTAGRTI